MCTDNSTSGTADTTSTGIALEGKVLTQNGNGAPNVLARVANSDISDLTNESGHYSIHINPDSLMSIGITLDSLSDTVQIVHENTVIESIELTTWQDTLPDVYLTQRSVSGNLLGNTSAIIKIEAILNNLTDTTETPKVFALWFNNQVNSYNNFIYFKQELVPTQYSIYVRVYTSEFIVSGISQQLIFPNTAGDIELAPFDVNNVKSDIIKMNNVVVSISDTTHLSATITGNTSPIIKYEWDIGNMGNYVESSGPATNFVAPDSTRSIVYILKVTDADGGVFQNSSILTVIEDAPEVTITTTDSIASINDSLHFKAQATDFYGTVIKYEWDFENTGVFIEGPLDGTFVGMSPKFLTDSLITLVRITDDDGITTTNFIATKVIEDAPVVSISSRDTVVSINDTLHFTTTSSDLFGSIAKYEWDVGNTGVFTEGPLDGTFKRPTSDTANNFFFSTLRVTDDDGMVTTAQIKSQVLQDNPLAAITPANPNVVSYPVDSIVSLLATSSIDSYGEIITYEWKAGDGDWFTGSEIQNIPTPPNIDTIFIVSLRVTDDDGNVSQASQKINLYGGTFLDLRNGHEYKVVTINDWIWFAEDLFTIQGSDTIKEFINPLGGFDDNFFHSVCPEGFDIINRTITENINTWIYDRYPTKHHTELTNYLFNDHTNPLHLSLETGTAYLGGRSTYSGGTYSKDFPLSIWGSLGAHSAGGKPVLIRCATQERLSYTKSKQPGLTIKINDIQTLFNYTVNVSPKTYTQYPDGPLTYYWDIVYRSKNWGDSLGAENPNYKLGPNNGTYTIITDSTDGNPASYLYMLYVKIFNHLGDSALDSSTVTAYDSLFADVYDIEIFGNPL